MLSEKLYDVSITKDGEILSLAITNEFVLGSVRVVKLSKDDHNKKLSGAVFELYMDVNDNAIFDPQIDKLIGTLTESEVGVYEYSELKYGGYFIYESKAPDDYVQDNRYFYFKITENGQIVTVENEKGVGFVNESVPKPEPEVPPSPQTGDNSNILAAVIMALSSLVIITITSIKLKKHKKS